MRATVGAGPIYGQRTFGLGSYAELLSFALLGVVAALVARGFKIVLARLERWFDTHPVPQPLRATLGGFLVGAIAVWLPAVVGNGYEPLNHILNSGVAAGWRVRVRHRTSETRSRVGDDAGRATVEAHRGGVTISAIPAFGVPRG